MNPTSQLTILLLTTSLLTGCVGTHNVLMMEQTNVGVDIDTKPPQSDFSIGRKELTIQPSFEGGKTISSVMGFRNEGSWPILGSFFFGAKDTFSTGKAASIVTSEKATPDTADTDGILLSEVPHSRSFAEMREHDLSGPRIMRPMVFGSRTHLGVHVNWDAETQLPSAIKVGFNRKVIAYAPVSYAAEKGGYRVNIPSTLAALDTNVTVKKGEAGNGYTQYFATGAAAENLAARKEIKDILLKRIEPAAKLTPGTISTELGDDLVAIDTLDSTDPAAIDAASKQATGKTWKEIKRRGTPEQIAAVAAECRKRKLLNP